MMSILFLLVGLGLILSGANFLTDGAAALAKRFNISSLVIGLTIVAFGTSAPELTVSIVSAINGSAELSIGNVVGSNIFNILMIVGVTAVVAPITEIALQLRLCNIGICVFKNQAGNADEGS